MRALAGQPVSPYRLGAVNAGASQRLELTFLDGDNVLLEADGESFTARYRLDNLTHHQQVLDWTAIDNTDNPVTITIPAALNAIYNNVDDFELFQVTVELTAGDETEIALFAYQVANVAQMRNAL